MLILGFDPSKSTGWALYDTDEDFSAIECGVFEMPDKADHYYTGDQLAAKVLAVILHIKKTRKKHPDFAVLEQQKESTFGSKGFDGIVYPWIASTAIVAMLSSFGIPYGTLTDSQWREHYGKGFIPPRKPILDENGKQETDRFGRPKFKNNWKEAAVNECQRIGISIPGKKTIAHNACEAVFLAIQWEHPAMKFHAKRYQGPWMALRQRRNDRAAA